MEELYRGLEFLKERALSQERVNVQELLNVIYVLAKEVEKLQKNEYK